MNGCRQTVSCTKLDFLIILKANRENILIGKYELFHFIKTCSKKQKQSWYCQAINLTYKSPAQSFSVLFLIKTNSYGDISRLEDRWVEAEILSLSYNKT